MPDYSVNQLSDVLKLSSGIPDTAQRCSLCFLDINHLARMVMREGGRYSIML